MISNVSTTLLTNEGLGKSLPVTLKKYGKDSNIPKARKRSPVSERQPG